MKSKTLALIFFATMLGGFFCTTIGDNSGNNGLLWFGIVLCAVCVASFIKWWKQQDQE